MINSGKLSFAGIRQCKPNRRRKLSRRPLSPRFEMLSYLGLQPFGRRLSSVILISRLGILPRGRGGTALAARYFSPLREAEVRFAALSARSFCSD